MARRNFLPIYFSYRSRRRLHWLSASDLCSSAIELLQIVRDQLEEACMSLLKRLWHFGQRHYRSAALRKAGVIFGPRCTWVGKKPNISNGGAIKLGSYVYLRGTPRPISLTTTESGLIEVGDRTFINAGVQIYSNARVSIGAASRIGDDCMIYDTSFHAVHSDQEPMSREVKIGRNVWLGMGVVVLPGVTIGDHSVLAAGAVVFSDVPAMQVWRGNPAQFYKQVRVSDPEFERR
jgi:acetyltransferase-like isoleucine patch superfamily enzyme